MKNIFAIMIKIFVPLFLVTVFFSSIHAQSTFVDVQKSNPRVATAFQQKDDTLREQFAAAKLQYPPKQIYIRSFKYDSQLEIWVRNNDKESFKLFKTYKVCTLSGSLGPKRIEGDYQVPEGFYYIDRMNPNSSYHLSLHINYPNASDDILSDSLKPGGDIYIHGNCVTVGCIPIMDGPIEDLYILATYAKQNGEDFIPVHVFPVRFNRPKSLEYLNKVSENDLDYQKFSKNLRKVYDYFEEHKKLPAIGINSKGEYVVMATM